jgi:two-component system sensor histidine kinase BaeS
VHDTGDGIAPRDLDRIWTRFFRAGTSRTRSPRGDDGVGLGLAITRGIVEAHGGSADAASVPGGGTTITLR